MTRFITLENAAWLLAGDDYEDARSWLALLAHHHQALHALTGDGTPPRFPPVAGIPVGASTWRMPVAAFEAWCKAHGYAIEQPSVPEDISSKPQKKSRRAMQIDAILVEVRDLDYNPLCIPRGGRERLKERCLLNPLFTESAFERAWQAAVSRGRVRVDGHERYARR